jgi:oligopeptidase A
VRFEQDTTVSTWHEDVRFYRVLDEQGQVVAGFYLDPFARQHKRGGAWKATLHARLDDHLPLALLNCNAAPGSDGAPALLEHNEVVTLFHEFGHGLHLMLGASPYPDVDMSAVEHDAIECPSQMFEQFAWDPDSLRMFGRHHETGQAIDEALIQAMTQARDYNAGLFVVRQLGFGLTDLALHTGQPPSDPGAVWSVRDEVNAATLVVPSPPQGQHLLGSFTHVFDGGYAAGYYGYLWAEVLAADAFEAIKQASNAAERARLGRAFRDEVLAMGAQRPFAESFVAFRGRPADPAALLANRGLLEAAAPRAKAGPR